MTHEMPNPKHLGTLALGLLFLCFVGPGLALFLAIMGHGWWSLLAWPVSTIVLTGVVYLLIEITEKNATGERLSEKQNFFLS